MDENPSRFKSPDRPVEQVTWEQCQAFCRTINERFPGLDLTLPTEAQWEFACRAGTETATYAGPLQIVGECNGPALDPIAWYAGNSGVEFELQNGYDSSDWPNKQYDHRKAGTYPAAQKLPNPWGLYDMLGNVWEWCLDGPRRYTEKAEVNPTGSIEGGADRVLRGSSWYSFARDVRCAIRNANPPGRRHDCIGFRPTRVQQFSKETGIVTKVVSEQGGAGPGRKGAARPTPDPVSERTGWWPWPRRKK
jgi:formylglycine-generating enzyme required for sulfatase activity